MLRNTLTCALWFSILNQVYGNVMEKKLIADLLTSYDATVRPIQNYFDVLNVTLDVSLHQIIEVDEKNEIITTNCWLSTSWIDFQLTWNKSRYSEISSVRIPHDRIWKPDIILYNNANLDYGAAIINTNAIIYHTGEVIWLSYGIYRSYCRIDVQYFPFDVQQCTLKWASWTYDGFKVDLIPKSEQADTSNYRGTGKFELLKYVLKKNVIVYSCCEEPYPDITYTIVLKRRPTFYVINLIIPCILINSIALLVFFVPSDSGEKVTLSISALLSMTVFLMIIRETLPPTEKTPLISTYYGVSIVLVTTISALSVVTLNIHHMGGGGEELAPQLKISTRKSNDLEDTASFEKHVRSNSNERFENSPPNIHAETKQPYLRLNRDLEIQIMSLITELKTTNKSYQLRLLKEQRSDRKSADWRKLSKKLDKCFFIIISAITIIATYLILTSSPHVSF